MSILLSDAWYSLNHSKKHIDEFRREVVSFCSSNIGTMFIEDDPNTGEEVYKFKFLKQLPDVLDGIVFDAISNMRRALDQAGYAVAVAANPAKGRNAHFPFGGSLAEAIGCHKGRSKDIPEEVFDYMISCKPYRGGSDSLWAMNKLCNTNKHEIVTGLCMVTKKVTSDLTVNGLKADPQPIRWDISKGEIETWRVSKKVNAHYDLQIDLSIAFDDAEFLAGKPISGTLIQLHDMITNILNGIETVMARSNETTK